MTTTLYHGGTIRPDYSGRTVAALAVADGRVLATGSLEEVRGRLTTSGAATVQEVDLDGATLAPGFIDAHVHPVLAGIVLIRTFLSWSLELEISGRWPWQQRGETPTQTG